MQGLCLVLRDPCHRNWQWAFGGAPYAVRTEARSTRHGAWKHGSSDGSFGRRPLHTKKVPDKWEPQCHPRDRPNATNDGAVPRSRISAAFTILETHLQSPVPQARPVLRPYSHQSAPVTSLQRPEARQMSLAAWSCGARYAVKSRYDSIAVLLQLDQVMKQLQRTCICWLSSFELGERTED
jgi:hypothetical protein